MRWLARLGLCLVLTGLCLPTAYGQWFQRDEPIMGTRIFVEIWQEDAQQAEALMQQVMDEMERINQLMSPYQDSSELAIINRQAATQPVVVGQELFGLIQTANRFSAQSNGAFDITFASLGHRFDYRNKVLPTQADQQAGAKLIDYRNLHLDERARSVRFEQAGMRIDLGGIAKGYAVDNAIALLAAGGVQHGIVTAGGDSRLLGDHRGRPWLLGIKHPRGDEHVITLPLSNLAISTSGDYERFFEQDGVRFHHIIDPAKGDSPRALMSATVLADRSLDADALSTTVFVLGPQKGLELVNSLAGVSAILIDRTGKVLYSNDLLDPTMQ